MDGRLKNLLAVSCSAPEKIIGKSEELLRLSAWQLNGGVLADPLLRSCICVDIAAEMSGESIEKSKLAQACGRDLPTYIRAYNSLKQFLPVSADSVSRPSNANTKVSSLRSPAKRLRSERDVNASIDKQNNNVFATPSSATTVLNESNADLDCSQLALKLGCVDLADRANRVLRTSLKQDTQSGPEAATLISPEATGASQKQRSVAVNWTLYKAASLYAVAQVARASDTRSRSAAPVRLNDKQLAEQSGVKVSMFNRLVQKFVVIAQNQVDAKNDYTGVRTSSAPRGTRNRSIGDSLHKVAERQLFSDSRSPRKSNRASHDVEPGTTPTNGIQERARQNDLESIANIQVGPLGNGLFRKQILNDVMFDFDFDPS